MLKALTIQDLAVVRHLDLEFKSGLTVITGETGAGKSILVDALGLVLGDRAEATLVRAGATKAVLSACFALQTLPALTAFLTEQSLNDGEELLLRRVIGADGRSRAFCNETPITAQSLREIGAYLVDIHGQHEHHSLLERAVQRALLDEFGAYASLLQECAEAYRAWAGARAASQRLTAQTGGEARADFLRFQLDELAQAGLAADEWSRLEGEHRRLANAQRLQASADEIAQRLFHGERSAARQVTFGATAAAELTTVDPQCRELQELLEQARINLDEAQHALARYRSSLAQDGNRDFAEIERRIGVLHDLARKHRCSPDTLLDVQMRLQTELDDIESYATRCAAYAQEIARALRDFQASAEKLSGARRAAAVQLTARTNEVLHQLGLPHARVEIHFERADEPHAYGTDEIEFMVSTNPDLPPRSLRKVASGGELSRISLAIQVATADTVHVPVLIYDEVDSGIGGRVATVVGQHLAEIAKNRQVLCVTHLAQVASAGTHHLSIQKSVEQGYTQTSAGYLSKQARVDEIARMLGGASTSARAHARELLAG